MPAASFLSYPAGRPNAAKPPTCWPATVHQPLRQPPLALACCIVPVHPTLHPLLPRPLLLPPGRLLHPPPAVSFTPHSTPAPVPSSRTPPPAVARLNVPPPATSSRPHARIPSPSYPGVNHQTPPTSSPLLPTQQTPVSQLNPPPLQHRFLACDNPPRTPSTPATALRSPLLCRR